jgi:hypothetical protein
VRRIGKRIGKRIGSGIRRIAKRIRIAYIAAETFVLEAMRMCIYTQ